VYYSNRSLCLAEKKRYAEAKADAEQCVKLEPSFVKGYHRLANAQFELGELDAAASTVREGLKKDPNMPDLSRLLRKIKAKKAAISSARKGVQTNVSESMRKEIEEMSEQYKQTGRDLSEVRARLEAAAKDQRRIAVMSNEVEHLSEATPLYQSVGKMFMLRPREEIKTSLREDAEGQEKRVSDLKSREQYLQRRLHSQEENMKDLIQSIQEREGA